MEKTQEMDQVNRYGLKRNIPEPVKRIVRQNYGFGCVICGNAIVQYHHFDPSFAEAKKHDPNRITILCPNCHSDVTSGLISDQIFRKSVASPKCLESGFSRKSLILGHGSPVVFFGQSLFVGTRCLIRVYGQPIFQVEEPESEGMPARLSAYFFNNSGKLVAQIRQNEWLAFISSWDVEFVKNKIYVRHSKGEFSLKIRLKLPNELIIERMDMSFRGWRFEVDASNQFRAYFPDGTLWFQSGGIISGCENGIIVQ